MKKILFLLILATLMFTVYGCNTTEKTPFSTVENLKEESVDYKIDKIILSKGFQSIEPNVEIIKKNSNLQLLVSLGLVEGSGVKIDKITKSGREINIYVNRTFDKDKVQLAIPQIMIEIDDPIIEKVDELNFNIVNQNYEPISLKFGKKEILNKICSKFEITPTTVPTIDLTKLKDDIFWDISFQNIFNRENSGTSLANFIVKVNANTGEILNSKKDIISTYIDDGYLLDYIPHGYLLYKKQHIEDDDNIYESLWTYNIKTKERTELYTSKNKIYSALFNSNGNYVSLIETCEEKLDIQIIPMSSKMAHKITPINFSQPKLIRWKDNNTLYFVDINEDTSTLLSYDIETNNCKVEFNLDMIVEDFDILGDKFVFIETNQDYINKNIYLTKDGLNLTKIDTGFKATFFNDNNILYLKNVEKEDKNILHIYDIKTNNESNYLDNNIANYFKLDNNSIFFIEKNTCNNNYTLNKYDVSENCVIPIAKISSDRIFYNPNNKKGYVNLTPPFDDSKTNVIYSINLDKLKDI